MTKCNVKSFRCAVSIICLIIWAPACHRWRHTAGRRPVGNYKKYVLALDGVECKKCILSALAVLEKIDGVKQTECRCKKKDYQSARFVCTLSAQSVLPIDAIQQELKRRDFALISVSGSFTGDLALQYEGRDTPVFLPASTTGAYAVRSRTDVLEEIRARAIHKPRAQLSGILDVKAKTITIE